MRFVSIRDLRSRSAEVRKRLDEDRDLVLTSNGKPIAIVSATDEENLERTLQHLRRARALQALADLQREASEAGIDDMSLDEIESEIAAARRDRRR
jgi:antitoxin (DNA-binding transcriptional repressor) of toxin-antitoxin stability system